MMSFGGRTQVECQIREIIDISVDNELRQMILSIQFVRILQIILRIEDKCCVFWMKTNYKRNC